MDQRSGFDKAFEIGGFVLGLMAIFFAYGVIYYCLCLLIYVFFCAFTGGYLCGW